MTAIIRSNRLTNSCKTTQEKKKPSSRKDEILPDVPLEVWIPFVHFSPFPFPLMTFFSLSTHTSFYKAAC